MAPLKFLTRATLVGEEESLEMVSCSPFALQIRKLEEPLVRLRLNHVHKDPEITRPLNMTG